MYKQITSIDIDCLKYKVDHLFLQRLMKLDYGVTNGNTAFVSSRKKENIFSSSYRMYVFRFLPTLFRFVCIIHLTIGETLAHGQVTSHSVGLLS